MSCRRSSTGDLFVAMTFEALHRKCLCDLWDGDSVHFFDPMDECARDRFMACEAALGYVPADWISQSRRLKWIQLDGVGFDDYTQLDWRELGQRVVMTNIAGLASDLVAQTAVAGVLGIYRDLPDLIRLQARKLWQKDAIRARSRSLIGKQILLAGYGSIAKRIEQLLEGFGCRFSRFSLSGVQADLCNVADVLAILPRMDVVICSLPETSATRGMIDAQWFSRMRSDALLVNVGRGGVVDESAVIELLQNGHLHSAMLDVTDQEPLPSDSPLWEMPNVLLTQHTAGGDRNEQDRKINLFAENLRRYRNREALLHTVDWTKGY